MSELTVWKSNEIVEAGYRLSLAEQRLILLSLGQLDSRDVTQKHVTLYAKDFAKEWGVDEKIAIRDLKLASNRLFERYVTLKNDSKVKKFRWIQSTTQYLDGQGAVEFTFSDDILPFLFKLEHSLGNFTKYELLNVSGFSSVYSFRLYELAVKLHGMDYPIVEMAEIRRILQVEDKYPEFREFNRNVIAKALKDINEKSDLLLAIDPIKRGRKIVALNFLVTKKAEDSLTKTGRPPLPKRPKIKAGTHEEGEFIRSEIKVIRDYWLEKFEVKSLWDVFHLMPTSELKLLYTRYKKLGDWQDYERIEKVLKLKEKN